MIVTTIKTKMESDDDRDKDVTFCKPRRLSVHSRSLLLGVLARIAAFPVLKEKVVSTLCFVAII